MITASCVAVCIIPLISLIEYRKSKPITCFRPRSRRRGRPVAVRARGRVLRCCAAAPPFTELRAESRRHRHAQQRPRRSWSGSTSREAAETSSKASRKPGTYRDRSCEVVSADPRAHHATSPPPRSPRRAATPLALEHTLQRCAPPPPRDASIGRPRVTHSRVHLAQDRRPHEARDAGTVTAAPTPCHVQAGRSQGTAGSDKKK